jgi:hypothetical protein
MALAMSSLHYAQEALLLHQSQEKLAATASEVEAAVQTYLAPDDPRRIAFQARATRVSGRPALDDEAERADRQYRQLLAMGLRAANESARAAAARILAFRNTILLTAIMLTAVVAVIAVVAALSPELVPVCQVGASGSSACPSGAAHPTGADVLLIELMGVLGGALTGMVGLGRSADEPRSAGLLAPLTLPQAPGSSSHALLGVLILQDDGLLVDVSLETGGATLTAAALLGTGQLALTGWVDKAAKPTAAPPQIKRRAPSVTKDQPSSS